MYKKAVASLALIALLAVSVIGATSIKATSEELSECKIACEETFTQCETACNGDADCIAKCTSEKEACTAACPE